MYYYTRDKKNRMGPVSVEQLRQMARDGELAPHDMVQKLGGGKWQPAETLPGLFSAQPSAISTSSPGPSSADKRKLSGAANAVVLAAVCLPFMCCTCTIPALLLGDRAGGERGAATENENVITADYLPCKSGAQATYDTLIYIPDKGAIDLKYTLNFERNGTIKKQDIATVLLDQTGRRISTQNKSDSWETKRYFQEAGYVWMSSKLQDGTEITENKLKIGATVGDTWTDQSVRSLPDSYSVLRFDKYSVKFDHSIRPSVVIQIEQNAGSSKPLVSVATFVKNIGLVQKVIRQGGEMMSKWELDDEARPNATPAQRAFFK